MNRKTIMNNRKVRKGFPIPTILSFLLGFIILASKVGVSQIYPKPYLQQALENNPSLQAQYKTWEAAQQQIDISGSLPDPTLSAGFFIPPMERFMGNQWYDIGLMQMFPWFGTLSKHKSAAEKMAESQYHQFRDDRNRLFIEMTRLWLEIYRKEQELKIIERHQKIIRSRENIIYTRYEAGQQRSGLALDIYRMEIQLAALENRADKTSEDLRALAESFNIIAGREKPETVETPDTLPVFMPKDSDRLPGEEVFVTNPQINRAQAAAEAAEIQQEISLLKTRPMLGVGLQYSYFAPGDAGMGQMDGGHMLMPMVSVSLPIFSRKNQATQQQSRLLADAAQFRWDDNFNTLETQWSQLRTKINNLHRDRDFYLHQYDITQKTWELVINAYASGDEGFDELLRIQDQLLELEWRMLENQINHHLARAEMDLLMARNIFE